MIKFLCVVGTRPEVIKMAPIIMELKKEKWAKTCILATAQHREMLDQMLTLFGILPDIDLNIMQENQALPDVAARLLAAINQVLKQEAVDAVIAQGDTTTVLMTALGCFYNQIPFCHIEAGLRSFDLQNPYPEEANRIVADRLAKFNFAPTENTKQNLLHEGIDEKNIYVTGNTVIDALYYIAEKKIPHSFNLDPSKRLILVTIHRRESFGEPFLEICKAIRTLADLVPDIEIFYPVHPNPNIAIKAYEILGNHPRIILSKPLDYEKFVALLQQAYLVLTDSGGIQEEAPAFGKPVLILRDKTDRLEGLLENVSKIVGRQSQGIVAATLEMLNDKTKYLSMVKNISPYGDGMAAKRIVKILKENFKC